MFGLKWLILQMTTGTTSGQRCSSFCSIRSTRIMSACEKLLCTYFGIFSISLKKRRQILTFSRDAQKKTRILKWGMVIQWKATMEERIYLKFCSDLLMPDLPPQELPGDLWEPAAALFRRHQTNACPVHAGSSQPAGNASEHLNTIKTASWWRKV